MLPLLPSIRRLLFLHLTFIFLICERAAVDAQVPIPPRYDGFAYGGGGGRGSIEVEAFFDPVCPDSRDAWPPLKQALTFYLSRGQSVSLIVHPFPLPYHDNAFVTSRALHIANRLNTSTTYPLLELFFKHQELSDPIFLVGRPHIVMDHKNEKYYNKPTHGMSRASVVDLVVKLMVEAAGNSSLSAIESGFEDVKTDLATRISFKYGCSRGVTGTPFFFVNGFPLPGSGSALDFNKWRSIIDPLLSLKKVREGDLHYFL